MEQCLDRTEAALRRAVARVDRGMLAAVGLAAVLCMWLVHGFAFANLFPNHDSTVLVFDAQWTMYVLGRWAQIPYYTLVRGKVASPLMIGAFATLWLAVSGYCIAKLLGLRRWAAALLTALLGSCASVTAQLATYTFYTDAFLLAMALACVGAYALHALPRGWGLAAAMLCFMGSMALYQSYIQFAVGLCLLVLLRRAIQGCDWKPWCMQGLRDLAALAGGGVLYLVSVKVTLALTGYQLADTGNGLGQLARLSVGKLLGMVPASIVNLGTFLLGHSSWNDRAMRAATALLGLLALALLLRVLRGQGLRAALQSGIALVLLLLGLNVIYLLASGNVHILMQHAVFLLYAVPLLLCGELRPGTAPRALLRWVCGALIAFLVLRNGIYANGAYVYADLMEQHTQSQLYTILAELRDLPGYTEGETPIAFVGEPTGSAFAYHNPALARYSNGDLHQVDSAVTYDGTFAWYFRHVLGSTARVVDQQGELYRLRELSAVKAMPTYPNAGYCAIINGTAVVKLA